MVVPPLAVLRSNRGVLRSRSVPPHAVQDGTGGENAASKLIVYRRKSISRIRTCVKVLRAAAVESSSVGEAVVRLRTPDAVQSSIDSYGVEFLMRRQYALLVLRQM